MRELIADRLEEGMLVCFSGESAVTIPCPGIARPEGCRVILFDALAPSRSPYVSVSLARARKIGSDSALAFILEPDAARKSAIQSRFDRIFKS